MTDPAVTPADAPHSSTTTPTWKQTTRGFIGLIGVLFLIGAVSSFLSGDASFAECWKPGAIFAVAGLIGVIFAAGSHRVARSLGLPKVAQSMVAFGLAFSAMYATTEILNNRFDSALSKSVEGLGIGIVCGAMLYVAEKYRLFPKVNPTIENSQRLPLS